MIELTEIQAETVTELVNISIGRAASSLNQLVDEEISLNVPRVYFVDPIEAAQMIDEQTANGTCAVIQEFSGVCSGDALLIFPEEKSLELVRAIIGETVRIESIADLEHDALTEVGNIVLNASLGSLANLLDTEITCSLPQFKKGNGKSIFDVEGNPGIGSGAMAMFLEVDFELKQRKINGYVVIVLDLNSAQSFVGLVDGYTSKIVS